MNIPKHINTQFDQILHFCYNTTEGISDYLIDDYVTYKWTGIIANVRYPDLGPKKSALELLHPVFNKLININHNNHSLTSFNLQFGFQEKDFFKTYTINGYKMTAIELPKKTLHDQIIEEEITKDNLAETGTAINLDINNKPLESKTNFIET